MKIRKHEYGDCNFIGKKVEFLRKERKIKQKDFIAKLQLAGLDINPTSYSKLEGQLRVATDKEVFFIAQTLGVDVAVLFEK
ncbi:MAG: helix-turn-helix transcriptional regulator [Clostridia bacterium]|nr:helix-turn-helix transcriptional regulator [Clostridia bacterium]